MLSCLTVVHIPSSATWYLAHICELVARMLGNCRCDGKWSRDFHILVRNLCREVGAESGIHHALHGRVAGEAMAQPPSGRSFSGETRSWFVRVVARSTSASIVRSTGRENCRLRAASPIALSKQVDQAAASSCSGLVPMRAEPGIESSTSKRPSEPRDTPWSRPPVVRTLAV
jgi:hypothetical protein